MATNRPIDVERVTCETCLKEVPKSEATSPEATEYVLYFCGLDCYEQWKRSRSLPSEEANEGA